MNALETFVDGVGQIWGPLSSELVAGCRERLQALLQAPASEAWLAALHRQPAAQTELHRDARHGFLLLAHSEPQGLYRPPHDHGRGWVIYAIQQGEIEMGTYARVRAADGSEQLVRRDTTLLRPGQVQVYLPGDIHDTRCIAGPALLFRFTERDLKREDVEARQLTRYVERQGAWIAERAV